VDETTKTIIDGLKAALADNATTLCRRIKDGMTAAEEIVVLQELVVLLNLCQRIRELKADKWQKQWNYGIGGCGSSNVAHVVVSTPASNSYRYGG